MTETYRIPLKYHVGKYLGTELPDDGECLVIEHDKYDIMTYLLPVYGSAVRRYSVPRESADRTLTAVYGRDGVLKHVDVICKDVRRLIYINFADDEEAKETIWKFCSFEGEQLCRRISQYGGKVSRLFTEFFYDGEAVDFAVKIASPEEVSDVIGQYGGNAADNSGNFDNGRRIECDTDTWGAMIQCGAPDFRRDMYGFGVFIMNSVIENKALPKLNKAADFKFIQAEYG